MAIKCPKCQFENPNDTIYCGKCAAPLHPDKPAPTRTMQMPSLELSAGKVFAGRYEVVEELGRGGMGEVYKVFDKQINEEIALKLLKPEIAADGNMIERFRNELKIARKITHKNVCRMHDINEEEGTPYITMEYVAGVDLKSLVKSKGKLSQEEAIGIAKQVCEGLAEAHELGVVHRDLKPQNIMIDEKSYAKIMDFGIARSVEASGVTATGMIIGTPDYISPEQAEGEEADTRSDIYSLGVILYEMVTGSVPFRGDTALSVALKHKTQLPLDPRKLNPDVSEDLSRLILICMEKDRERRYQTPKALLSDLRNIEDGLPLGTKIRPRRKSFVAALIRKKLFIPSLAVALAIIAVITWQLLPQKGAGPSAPSDKPSLAVVYFENNTGDESLDYWKKALSELLIADLSQSKHLDVLTGDRLFKILSQMNQLEAKTYSADVLKEVAAQGGMENILRGSYTKAGDSFRIDVMLQNANSGELIASERAEGKGEESFFSIVDELTKKIKLDLNISREQIAGDIDEAVGKITTSSPEAYKYYSEGIKYYQKGDYSESVALLEKAVAIDPEFAMAYRTLAIQYSNKEIAPQIIKKYFQKAFELTDRTSDRERYRIQGEFHSMSGEINKAIEAFHKLLRLYPEDWIGNNSLGRIYEQLEQWDKAIERYEVNIQNKVEAFQSYHNLAVSYMAKGLYDKAREVCELYLNSFQDNKLIHRCLLTGYLIQKKYDLALAEVDKIVFVSPLWEMNIFWLRGSIYHCKGDLINAEKEYQKLLELDDRVQIVGRIMLVYLYLLEGKFVEAKVENRQRIELAKKLLHKAWEGYGHYSSAYINLRSGNPEEALKECDKAWGYAVEAEDLIGQIGALHLKGTIYLALKSLEEAQRTANALKDLVEEGMDKEGMRLYFRLRGMIELERENLSKAIEDLKKAISLLPYQYKVLNNHSFYIEPLALAYYKAGDIEKAREEYEKIISLTTGRLPWGDIYAKSFYMLAKIYEQEGDKTKAIEHYEKFLSLWKDADPGIAEVEDAKKSLVGLKVPIALTSIQFDSLLIP